jgi:hypothetical protein
VAKAILMNTLRNLGAAPGPTLASFGQQYKPPATFDQRFGPYDARPSPEMLRQMFEEEMKRQQQQQMLQDNPGMIIPGQDMIDYYGNRGVRHPSGYYQTKGI